MSQDLFCVLNIEWPKEVDTNIGKRKNYCCCWEMERKKKNDDRLYFLRVKYFALKSTNIYAEKTFSQKENVESLLNKRFDVFCSLIKAYAVGMLQVQTCYHVSCMQNKWTTSISTAANWSLPLERSIPFLLRIGFNDCSLYWELVLRPPIQWGICQTKWFVLGKFDQVFPR